MMATTAGMELDLDELIRALERMAHFAGTPAGQRRISAALAAGDDVDRHLEAARFVAMAEAHRPEEH
ncbi:MAG TPA: hypothetical protein ENK19_10035 [Acidobacteria bacterium]|nr:hypothetical protein [Acidobacteriota bacterium]